MEKRNSNESNDSKGNGNRNCFHYPRETVMHRSGRGMRSRRGKVQETTIGYEAIEKRRYPKILQEYESTAYQKLRR